MESGDPGFAEIFFVAGCGTGNVSLPGLCLADGEGNDLAGVIEGIQ